MTTASVAYGSAPWKVMLYGQSLCVTGAVTNDSIGDLMMVGRRASWSASGAISGFPWSAATGLAARATERLAVRASKAPTSVLVMIGGTTDYALGVSGPNCVLAQENLSDTARGLGFDYVVTTTTTPSTGIVGANETKRLAGNAQLILDANAKFDYVVELAEDTLLDDATDAAYYSDGTHPTLLGRQRMAVLIDVALDAIGVP